MTELPNTRLIPLTQGKFAIVDAEIFDELNSLGKWHIDNKGYVRRTFRENNKNILKRLHRLIMDFPEGIQIDHINNNKLDNRKCNLRLANNSQNQINKKIQSNNKSGYKGVDWHRATQKWRAQIRVNNKVIHLGLFLTKEDAAIAYNNIAIKHHGEFINKEITQEQSK